MPWNYEKKKKFSETLKKPQNQTKTTNPILYVLVAAKINLSLENYNFHRHGFGSPCNCSAVIY